METNDNDTLEKVIAEMRNRSSGDGWLQTVLKAYANRLEAIAKRAYNDIDKAVCGIEDASNYDIDDVRIAMDKTIGDYYE